MLKNDGINHLYFVSEADTIKAVIQNNWSGTASQPRQSFLKAEKSLTEIKYKLMVLNDSINETMKCFNSQTSSLDTVQWNINHSSDTIAPSFDTNPILIRQNFEMPFSCTSTFEYNTKDSSKYFIEVKVRIKSENNWTTLFVRKGYDFKSKNEKKIFDLGWVNCYGVFSYERNTNYEAKFRLVDLKGNRGEQFSPIVEFSTPN